MEKISTHGRLISVGGFNPMAGLNYQIPITPNGKSGGAEGTVQTEFSGSILEVRDGAATGTDTGKKPLQRTRGRILPR